MTQPGELKLNLPMELSNGVISTTTKVWEILTASYEGNLVKIKRLVEECPELIYAQYNYTPPIHFAVREGHTELVKYILEKGAHDSSYRIYPFLDNLVTIAEDRNYKEIAQLLNEYAGNPNRQKYKGDNGHIDFQRTLPEQEFQQAVDKEDLEKTRAILNEHPEFAKDETFFWGEGILVMAAKEKNFKLMELLISHGARVPDILKWTQFYYFEKYESAVFLMEKGMNPNTKSWQEVTLLHDMAQKGELKKAELLIKFGADINAIDDEYQSTPLGMAARWGHAEMVNLLLDNGADPNRSGAEWSTPLAWAMKKGNTEVEKILRKTRG
jgi:uncharacterized protein